MNVVKINEYLSDNCDAIITLLEKLGLSNIRYNAEKHEVRCSREEGRNPTSVKIDTSSLYYNCFSTGRRGDIYVLVMDRLNLSFPEALRWVISTLKLDAGEFNSNIRLPFGGYYKDIIRETDDAELNLPTYDQSILENYSDLPNDMFLCDNISTYTQKKFNVGYDCESKRITVPQWSVNGDLVGIMGRLNDPNCDKSERWLPIIPCARSMTVYGYHFNYAAIQQKSICMIVESEKSVMQMDSMNLHVGLATCKNSISDIQARYIKGLMTDKIIIAYDEGVEEEYLRYAAEKVKIDTIMFKNSVGYIFDEYNEILPKDSKASPTDLGYKKLQELMRSKIKWI